MPAPRPVVIVDAAKAAPVEYEVAGGVAARPLTLSAIFNGAAAAATFLPCCSIYAPGGELLSRTFPDGGIGAGDSAEVTFAPFLRTAPETPAPSGGGMDRKHMPPSAISLPLLELSYYVDPIASSGTVTWAQSSSYPYGGYVQLDSDGAYIAVPVVIGPQGSWWVPLVLYDIGPNNGKLEVAIGTAEYQDDGNGWPGTFEPYADVGTFVLLQTYDLYAAAGAVFTNNGSVPNQFQLTGVDGAVATSYTSFLLNGGAGTYWLRLRINGRNAASGGFRARISSLYMLRLDNDLVP